MKRICSVKVSEHSKMHWLGYINKNKNVVSKKVVVLSFLLCSLTYGGFSQQSIDFGVWGGSSTYFGDLSNVQHFENIKPTFGIFLRHNFNPRVALRIMYLKGNLQKTGTINGVDWAFSKNVQDLSIQAEINYLKYLFGVESTKCSPYITGGVGVNYFPYQLTAYGDQSNSGINTLSNIKKDSFLKDTFVESDENVIQMNIALGFGIKFNVSKKVAIGAEYQMRKLFSDKLDNLDDPLAHTKMIRGKEQVVKYTDFMHNNDWLGYLGLHVSYKFNLIKKSCPAYDRKYW